MTSAIKSRTRLWTIGSLVLLALKCAVIILLSQSGATSFVYQNF